MIFIYFFILYRWVYQLLCDKTCRRRPLGINSAIYRFIILVYYGLLSMCVNLFFFTYVYIFFCSICVTFSPPVLYGAHIRLACLLAWRVYHASDILVVIVNSVWILLLRFIRSKPQMLQFCFLLLKLVHTLFQVILP